MKEKEGNKVIICEYILLLIFTYIIVITLSSILI